MADHGVGRTPAGANSGLQATGQIGIPIEIAGQCSARMRSVDALVSWRDREQAAAEGRAGGAAIAAYGHAVVAPTAVRIEGAADHSLRAILSTALVAAIGFVPAAIATGTGAEVQRPLATVVIGGLVAAMLLSLPALPTMLLLVTRKESRSGAPEPHRPRLRQKASSAP